MGTKTAVAFSVNFMTDLKKRLLMASPCKPLVWKQFSDDIFSLWNISIAILLTLLTRSTLESSSLVKCHLSALFFLDTEVGFQRTSYFNS